MPLFAEQYGPTFFFASDRWDFNDPMARLEVETARQKLIPAGASLDEALRLCREWFVALMARRCPGRTVDFLRTGDCDGVGPGWDREFRQQEAA